MFLAGDLDVSGPEEGCSRGLEMDTGMMRRMIGGVKTRESFGA
jgi:hypothetical protein